MTSRRYIKRIWRVPKDRGPVEYFATLVTKALVKHGWPAKWRAIDHTDGFYILHDKRGGDLPPDFENAVQIAVRILARTYRVEVSELHGTVLFNRRYRVTAGGHFREEKT